ncbi:hypothetical protein I4F81_003160 [Pyropia yezoensis]|uniref:Uncharacterized protein n=1 Tax=Pyropia yezoensis TaxID=2788 RepID=A0ACC3BRU1_PYRYE|nr:hypothetical protein I4F81_003160 [Neopyropia yezoensis]
MGASVVCASPHARSRAHPPRPASIKGWWRGRGPPRLPPPGVIRSSSRLRCPTGAAGAPPSAANVSGRMPGGGKTPPLPPAPPPSPPAGCPSRFGAAPADSSAEAATAAAADCASTPTHGYRGGGGGQGSASDAVREFDRGAPATGSRDPPPVTHAASASFTAAAGATPSRRTAAVYSPCGRCQVPLHIRRPFCPACLAPRVRAPPPSAAAAAAARRERRRRAKAAAAAASEASAAAAAAAAAAEAMAVEGDAAEGTAAATANEGAFAGADRDARMATAPASTAAVAALERTAATGRATAPASPLPERPTRGRPLKESPRAEHCGRSSPTEPLRLPSSTSWNPRATPQPSPSSSSQPTSVSSPPQSLTPPPPPPPSSPVEAFAYQTAGLPPAAPEGERRGDTSGATAPAAAATATAATAAAAAGAGMDFAAVVDRILSRRV